MAVFIKKNNQLQPVGSMGAVVRDNSLVKSIVDRSITTVTAEDLAGITSIGNYAFYSCRSLTSVTIPDSVTSIGTCTFQYCTNLTSITIPDGITNINSFMFFECTSLTSIDIPDSVTTIDGSAFYNCRSLIDITIPDSVMSIGSGAFYNCTSLTEIHFRRSTPATVSNINAWSNIPTTCKIYVPTGSRTAYESAPNYPDPNTYQYIEE